MPIDPSIAMQIGQNQPQPMNGLQVAGQAQGLINQQQANKLQQVQTQQAQTNLGTSQQNSIAGHALGLINSIPYDAEKDPNDTRLVDAYMGAVHKMVASGEITQQAGQAHIDYMANTVGPHHFRQGLVQTAINALPQVQQFANVFGTNEMVGNGKTNFPVVRGAPMTGGAITPSGPGIPQYTTPAQDAGRVQTGVGPNGETIMGAAGPVTPGQYTGAGSTGLYGNMGDGRGNPLPNGLLNPKNQGTDGNVVTSQGPATTAAQSQAGASSAKNFDTISTSAVAARSRDALLANLQSDLTKFMPGTGAAGVLATKRFLSSWDQRLGMGNLGIDGENVGAQESFNKFIASLQATQGSGSDAQLANAGLSLPHDSLSAEGLAQILPMLRGNEQYIMARGKAAGSYSDQFGKSDSQGFENKVGATLDPRAFQMARMSVIQRRSYMKSLQPADQDAIMKSYKAAGLGNAGQ